MSTGQGQSRGERNQSERGGESCPVRRSGAPNGIGRAAEGALPGYRGRDGGSAGGRLAAPEGIWARGCRRSPARPELLKPGIPKLATATQRFGEQLTTKKVTGKPSLWAIHCSQEKTVKIGGRLLHHPRQTAHKKPFLAWPCLNADFQLKLPVGNMEGHA